MILQLIVLLTGAFGAFLFRLKQTPPPRLACVEDPGTWLEVCLAGASSVVTWALLPADWQTWLANPLLAGCAAFVVNGGGVNLASNVLQKLPAALRGNGGANGGNGAKRSGPPRPIPPPPPRPGSTGSIRLGFLLALAVAALAGAACAALGIQSTTVAFDRNELLFMYADLKEDYGAAKQLFEGVCAGKDSPLCQRLAAADSKLKAADARFRQRVRADQFDLNQIDFQELAVAVPRLMQLAATVGAVIPK